MRATLLLLLAAGSLAGQELTDKSCEKLCELVLPGKAEQTWQKIPWRATYWEGVVEAWEEDKPVLLWAMNGHPMGLT